eukprot:CAMPEP_0206845700 /NCGR_PEP_ID=MMETSP0975-20121206/24620_1 /ASSEMBLY_ACC=CAM_ASM_000399 /TAXON_ID=483370 /ORGANISM="non described non described, Strain CCMP2097" /LENGTH=78 /DNA_ID=CAMNT_0054388285 /DNA_START=378 /DNA_END=611 /DNA_ORIENTATION=+
MYHCISQSRGANRLRNGTRGGTLEQERYVEVRAKAHAIPARGAVGFAAAGALGARLARRLRISRFFAVSARGVVPRLG